MIIMWCWSSCFACIILWKISSSRGYQSFLSRVINNRLNDHHRRRLLLPARSFPCSRLPTTLHAIEKEEANDGYHHLFPSKNCTIDQVSPVAMAYIGDVVFELFARSRYVWPAKRTTDLQNSVVNLVRGMYMQSLVPSRN